jgi:hypothetical protein
MLSKELTVAERPMVVLVLLSAAKAPTLANARKVIARTEVLMVFLMISPPGVENR